MNVIDTLDALANTNRLKILYLLRKGPHSTRRIAKIIGTSRSAVTQHLHTLRDVGLVGFKVEGKNPQYYIKPSGFTSLRKYIESYEKQPV